MSQLIRCQYAVIKYAHDPVRFEPVNVGIVIWPKANPLAVKWRFDDALKRIEKLYPSANVRAIKIALAAFKSQVISNPDLLWAQSPMGDCLLVTEPRAAQCADIDVELGDVFDSLVAPLPEDIEEPREKTRSARFIKGRMNTFFQDLDILEALTSEEAQTFRMVECRSGIKHTFDFAYKNGATNRIDTISFDNGTPAERMTRARSFANLVDDVRASQQGAGGVIKAVIQVPTQGLGMEVYTEAMKILNPLQIDRIEVRNDDDLRDFCGEIKRQLEAH